MLTLAANLRRLVLAFHNSIKFLPRRQSSQARGRSKLLKRSAESNNEARTVKATGRQMPKRSPDTRDESRELNPKHG